MQQVSAVLIVKNAASDLPRCLDSLRWASEIVVVDSISSDNTVELARRYTDKVIQRPWPGYAEQKNFAISQAGSSWILSMDADEALPPETINEIQSTLGGPQAVAYRFPRRNIFHDHWVQGCGWYPDWQTRLFRKGSGLFKAYHVHESLEVNGPVGALNNPILHYSYKCLSQYFGKSNQYTSLEVEDMAANSTQISNIAPFQAFCDKFIQAFTQLQGWRDGAHGLIITTGVALYEFYKYFKALTYFDQTGRHGQIRLDGRSLTALDQFRDSLSKVCQSTGINAPGGFRIMPQNYHGLGESLKWLEQRDINSFLGEANRLSDADADRLTPSTGFLVDQHILAWSLEMLRCYPGADWHSLTCAMGAFTYAFMVWSKVWERLIWNNRQQAIQLYLTRDARACNELAKSIQRSARYLWYARRG